MHTTANCRLVRLSGRHLGNVHFDPFRNGTLWFYRLGHNKQFAGTGWGNYYFTSMVVTCVDCGYTVPLYGAYSSKRRYRGSKKRNKVTIWIKSSTENFDFE